MIQRICTISLLVCVAWLYASPARADVSKVAPEIGYDHGDVEDARQAANAGALRANGNGIDGIWVNPASLVATPVYHVGAVVSVWPEPRRQSYGIGAMDSVTSRLAAGLGFVWSLQDPQGIDRETRDFRLAIAYPFSPAVGVGLTARYLWAAQRGLGPLGPSYASGGLKGKALLEAFSFDAGVRIAPTENFNIGILGSNLSNPGNGFQPTTVGGGIGVGVRTFSFEVDGLADFTTWRKTTARVMAAAEYLAADCVPLRLGYGYESGRELHGLSAGVGYIDTAFSVELAARRGIVGDKYTAIFLTVQYFVESSGLTRSPSADF